MTVQNIVAGVNAKLAGENLTYNQMRLFLDETIDDINNELSSNFPDFTEISAGGVYDFFPERYIRSVVILGAAYKFYVTDEEGAESAKQFQAEYRRNLFLMKRDYSERVPEAYQDFNKGYLTGPIETTSTDSQLLPWWWTD